MNNHMCEHPATQANLDLLRARGVAVVEPGSGALASRGEWGGAGWPSPPRSSRPIEAALGGGRSCRARSTACACS